MTPNHTKLVAETAIGQTCAGGAAWLKDQPAGVSYMPYNPVSGRAYTGPNAIWLVMQGRSDPRWLTSPQAAAHGAQMLRGEHGVAVQFWQWETQAPLLDDDGQPRLDAAGRPASVTVALDRPCLMTTIVFNAEQIMGLEPAPLRTVPGAAERRQLAQALIERAQAQWAPLTPERIAGGPRYGAGSPTEPQAAPAPDHDYAAALRDVARTALRQSQPDRGPTDVAGSLAASLEAVRVDLAAYLLGDALGLGYTPQASPLTWERWTEALAEDPAEIFRAARDGAAAVELILSLQRDAELTRGLNPNPPDATTIFHPAEALESTPALAVEARAVSTDVPLAQQTQKRRARQVHDAQLLLDLRLDHTPEHPPPSPNSEQDLAPDVGAAEPEPDFEAEVADEIAHVAASGAESVDYETAGGRPHIEERLLAAERIDLTVPYAQHEEAKGLGAQWDLTSKTWFAPGGIDQAPLKRWMPAEYDIPRALPEDPVQAFHSVLADAGFQLGGQPPQLDGQLHRVPVNGDKAGDRSGAYRAVDDRDKGGHPAGWFHNLRDGVKDTWTTRQHGRVLTEIDRAGAHAAAAQRRNELAEAQAVHAKIAAQAIDARLAQSQDAPDDHPYLQAKGVPDYGLSLAQGAALSMPPGDADPQLWGLDGHLIVPARDINGDLRSAQAISPTGSKALAKGASWLGAFHMIGVPQSLDAPLLIAEDYATAAELHRATGFPVAVAFTANNLEPVARALRDMNPDRAIGIAGDNDHITAQEVDAATGQLQRNVGVISAEKAAQAIDGFTLIPEFDPADRGTNWNDLRASRGPAEIRSQLAAGLAIATRERLARDMTAGLVVGPTPAPGLLSSPDREALRHPPSSPALAPERTLARRAAPEATVRDISDRDLGR